MAWFSLSKPKRKVKGVYRVTGGNLGMRMTFKRKKDALHSKRISGKGAKIKFIKKPSALDRFASGDY